MPIGFHGCLDRLALIHLELLQDIFSVLFLMDECPFLHLFDLKTKEEGQYANESFDGFENISKDFDLVKICTT